VAGTAGFLRLGVEELGNLPDADELEAGCEERVFESVLLPRWPSDHPMIGWWMKARGLSETQCPRLAGRPKIESQPSFQA
jgi:hypothetical protein